ncbi:MAG TPA: LacI family DNA-binding transcriptional regulator [Rectinemataceae bacterium]|nr:LacI family DNA-binding transcriptional regulator [Rectinemataceae bacterium]
MISIKDLAKLVGVSPSTISRAVNGKKYVKPEIRDRILELVKETGYVPNNAARSMVLKRTFTVGIVIPDTFNMFQRQLFSTIERSLEGFGYRTMFFFVKWEPESELKCLRRLKAEKLDGIIMLHEVTHPSFYEYLEEGSVPVVLCTFARAASTIPSVHVDEEAGARAATAHLIELGHRRIGLISGAHFSFGAQRTSGYRAALEAAGISFDENRIVLAPSYTPEAGQAGMRTLLDRAGSLTAVFAVTDELAIGAVRTLYERGLSVPRDVSVVGFDDIDITPYLSPALSTVRQPIYDMGRRAAEVMSRQIAGERQAQNTNVFGFELVVRESSAALR